MWRFLCSPFAPLVVFALLAAAALCAYVGARAAPSVSAESLLAFGWALLLILWVDADAQRRRCRPCYDFGFLVGLTFPASLVWYCLWSRGWRGFSVLLGFVALWLVPWAVALLFWAVSAGRA